MGHVLRFAHSTNRDAIDNRLRCRTFSRIGALEQLCTNGTRPDTISGDPVTPQFESPDFSHTNQTSLGCGVCTPKLLTKGRTRRDVHDPTKSSILHAWQDRLKALKSTT